MRIKLVLMGLLLFLTACSGGESKKDLQREDGQETMAKGINIEVVADNLQIPWSIDKHQDTFYISERSGTIMKIAGDRQSRQKVLFEKPLATAAEAGFLGFLLSPDFSKTKQAFAYYTYQDDSGQYNRIVTLGLDGDVWKEEKLLLDKIPSGRVHHGGRLKIGSDGKLYATTGDGGDEPEIAQDVPSLGGKILRLEPDGSIPADNPFPDSYVYSYGHRNPQGLAWDDDGQLYSSEHGPSAHDEINLIKKAGNYGWPVVIGEEKRTGVESPLFQSGADDTWAPSGMAFHNGKLYVATLRGNAVRVFAPDTMETREVITGLGRIRDVWIEDGLLYFVSNNTDGRGTPDENDDKLYRVELDEL